MAEIVLTALVFDTPEHAGETALEVARLVDQRAVELPSWASIAWARETTAPRVQLDAGSVMSRDQFHGFWHVLIGITLFGPLLDAAAARPAHHASGALGAIGIDEVFLNRVRDAVSPGTSALFMLSSPAAADLVYDSALDGERRAAAVIAKTLPMSTWELLGAEEPDGRPIG